jgi:hypothetical protein
MIRTGKIEDAKTIIGFHTWNSLLSILRALTGSQAETSAATPPFDYSKPHSSTTSLSAEARFK